MAGKFQWKNFNSVNFEDNFFDSLKADYSDFITWFRKNKLLTRVHWFTMMIMELEHFCI